MNYQKLEVWKKAMELTMDIYKMIHLLPKFETYALSDQMRCAVVSIPSNIAEGATRETQKEFKRFLYIAKGSACELETQCMICEGIGYIGNEIINPLLESINEIKRMLSGLIFKLDSYNA